MSICFPGVNYTLSKTDWFAELENGSQIWFGGLMTKSVQKDPRHEFATIYLNECSRSRKAQDIAVTRLAQQVTQIIGNRQDKPLKPRMYYDCNPPSKVHWSYRMFVEKRDPETKKSLANPEDYACFQINPQDNAENISAGYLENVAEPV